MARSINSVIVDLIGNSKGLTSSVNDAKGSILSTLGNLGNIATGIQSAFQLAGSAITPVINYVNQASAANLGLINTANQFAAISGLSYGESEQALRSLTKEMNTLGETLPGTTDDYLTLATSITDNLIPAVSDLDGEFTVEGLNKYAKELSKNFGFIAATTEATASEIGLGLNRALTEGTSLATLRQLAAFEKNPAILAQIEKIAESMGVEFDKATTAQRVQILTEASAISSEALDAAAADLSVIISGIQGKLFGSQGLFSFERMVDTGGGVETNVIRELGSLLNDIVSPSGPFGAVFNLLSDINFDPALMLVQGIQNFRSNVLPIIENLANAFAFEGLAGGINASMGMLAQVDFNQIGVQIGNMLGRIINYISAQINSLDMTMFSAVAANIMSGLGHAVLATVSSINWGALVSAAGTILISSTQIGLQSAMMLMGSSVQQLGSLMASQFNQIVVSIRSRILLAIAQMKSAVANIGNAFQPAIAAIRTLIASVRASIAPIVNAQNAASGLGNAFSAIARAIQGLRSTLNGIGSAVNGVIGRANSAISSIQSTVVPNAADGFTPSSFAGQMIASAINERSRMPNGSNLVMANSSEMILNQDQQSALLNRLGSSGNISITINGNDPFTIAREVEKVLKNTFNNRAKLA